MGDKKKYKEYKNLDFAGIGKTVLDYWNENNVFENSVVNREGNPVFAFYEGPPSANGTPGIHHVMSRTVKDIFCRFKTMEGYQVKRKGGWDTHGLPVELQVEKEVYNRFLDKTKVKHKSDKPIEALSLVLDCEILSADYHFKNRIDINKLLKSLE